MAKLWTVTVVLTMLITAGCRPIVPLPPEAAPLAESTSSPGDDSVLIPSIEPEPIDSASAAIISAIQTATKPEVIAFESSDGKLRVELERFDCTPTPHEGLYAYETVKLVDSEGSASLIDSQLIACGGLGAFGLAGLFWSPGDRYFFYTTAREGTPDGCGFWHAPIRRLDVQRAVAEELGAGWISPDNTKIAAWFDQHLVLWDINEGKQAQFPAADPAQSLAALSWTPDSRAVVYLQAPSPCDPLPTGNSVVVRVGVDDRAVSVLLETGSPVFVEMDVEGPNAIRLVDRTGAVWLLDESGLSTLETS